VTSILFLSPHPDDIAWSIGCLVDKIAHLSDSRMITLFSVCNYTPTIGRYTTDQATKIRITEDKQFCLTVGIRHATLDFAEGLVRGYPDIDSLFRFDKGSADPIYVDVRDRLRRYMETEIADLVFSPIALGHHIEHLICRDVAMDLCPVSKLLFYEDLPYAGFLSEAFIHEEITKHLGKDMQPFRTQGCYVKKLTLSAIYFSQFRAEVWQPIWHHANRLGNVKLVEQIWGAEQPLKQLMRLLDNK